MEEEETHRIKVFCCDRCDFSSRYFDRILNHYSTKHSYDPAFGIVCGIDGCQSRFSSIGYYKTHLRRKHPIFHHEHIATRQRQEASMPVQGTENVHDLPDPVPGNVNLDNLENINQEAIQPENDFNNELHELTAHKLLHLRELKKLTYKSIPHILEIMKDIYTLYVSRTKVNIENILHDENVSDFARQAIKEEFDNQNYDFQSLVETFSNEDRFNSFIADHFHFVEPEQKYIGEVEHGESFQYISILKTLQILMQNEEVFAQIMNSHESGDRALRDLCDGTKFAEHELFKENQNTLQIILYYDDFTVVNPIGYKASEYKFGAFYFTLGNIEPRYRSKLHVIQLVTLANSSTIKNHGFNAVLQPLVRDLQHLETEGIVIERPDGQLTLRGTVITVIGDNLGMHSLGGFMESFNVRRPCRFCSIEKDTLDNFNIANTPRRTPASYNDQVEVVSINPDMSSLYGVKANSVLNNLRYFHVVGGMPSDIAHDLFESGLACDILHCMIEYSISEGHFIMEYLNGRIQDFKYASTDKVNKPNKLPEKISKLKVKQNCAQIWTLVRLYPLLVGEAVPEGDAKWEMYLTFVDMVEALCAKEMSIADVVCLSDLINEFHEMYLEQFPERHLKPKGHYTLHYAEQVKEFGPLIHCWSVRFEGKHSFFKEIVRRTKNRKNLCKTMAMRHQYFQSAWSATQSFLSGISHEPFNGATVPVNFLSLAKQELLEPLIGESETVYQCKTLKINGTLYNTNCAVVTSFRQDSLQFGKFVCGFIIGGLPYLFCENLDTLEYQRHFHCFILRSNTTYSLFTQDSLLDHHPLGIYYKENDYLRQLEPCIVLHHKIYLDHMM